ncbi:hypothetical protein MPER_04390 [Moniliophthora perniciosa FA553]|nr:hypothetical protein MPER_04390 [Moniliophthora perniciosa FA553]
MAVITRVILKALGKVVIITPALVPLYIVTPNLVPHQDISHIIHVHNTIHIHMTILTIMLIHQASECSHQPPYTPADFPPDGPTRSHTPPVITSSSRVTLDQLVDLAVGELDPGDVVTVKQCTDRDYDIEVSLSKKK